MFLNVFDTLLFFVEISFVYWRLNTQFGEVKKQRLLQSCLLQRNQKKKIGENFGKTLQLSFAFHYELAFSNLKEKNSFKTGKNLALVSL